MNKLKPCPFCGEKNSFSLILCRTECVCHKCGAKGPKTDIESNAEPLWNTVETPWRPIEEAPKDGTHIILKFIQDDGEGACIEGFWGTVKAHPPYEDFPGWEVVSLPSHGCGCCGNYNQEPTHFMEIPELLICSGLSVEEGSLTE